MLKLQFSKFQKSQMQFLRTTENITLGKFENIRLRFVEVVFWKQQITLK